MKNKETLFVTEQLKHVWEEIYRREMLKSARDYLSKKMRAGIEDQELAELVVERYSDERLLVMDREPETREPRIICSMGLKAKK